MSVLPFVSLPYDLKTPQVGLAARPSLQDTSPVRPHERTDPHSRKGEGLRQARRCYFSEARSQ